MFDHFQSSSFNSYAVFNTVIRLYYSLNCYKFIKLKMSNKDKYDSEENQAIENFREYLRIPSVHPDVNYGK